MDDDFSDSEDTIKVLPFTEDVEEEDVDDTITTRSKNITSSSKLTSMKIVPILPENPQGIESIESIERTPQAERKHSILQQRGPGIRKSAITSSKHYVQRQASVLKTTYSNGLLISPTGIFRARWDGLIVVMLLYTAMLVVRTLINLSIILIKLSIAL